jgi:SPW repeat
MRIAQIAPLHGSVPSRTWTREKVLALIRLICAAIMFGSLWAFDLAQTPTWNLGICGYAMLTASLAALVAEADWEPRANLWLGVWILAAPWVLGFSHETGATLVHLVGGGLVSLLSALEVWSGDRSPPWRFGPAAAQRATLPTHAMTVALGPTTSQAVTAVRRRPIPAGGARFAASPVNLRPRHYPARRLQVSAGTRRLGRRACARLRSAIENETRRTQSSCGKHVSCLAQMATAVQYAPNPCCSK